MNTSKLNKVERDLIGGLEEFLNDLKADISLAEKYPQRRVTLIPPPPSIDPVNAQPAPETSEKFPE